MSYRLTDKELADVGQAAFNAVDAITEPIPSIVQLRWLEIFRAIPPETVLFIARELAERRMQ